MRRWLCICLTGLLLLSSLAGCGEKAPDPTEEEEGLHLTVRATAAQTNLEPARATANGAKTLVYHLYENLLKWVDDGSGNAVLVPGMAKDYTVEENVDGSSTYTFTLRGDIKWSDGELITSADFLYAWQRLFSMENPPVEVYQLYMVEGYQEAWSNRDGTLLTGVSAPDSHTLVIKTSDQCAYFLDVFCAGTLTMPVRQDLVEKYGENWGAQQEALVGNGPYTVQSITADEITVEKNDQYYDAAQVAADTITFRWTGDAEAAYQELTEGELDFLVDLPQAEVEARAEADTLTVEPDPSTYALLMNNAAAPFDNDFVRQAFAVCVDQEALTVAAASVTDTAATGFVPHGVTNRDDQFAPAAEETDPDSVVLPEDLLEQQDEEETHWDWRAVGDYELEQEETTQEERNSQGRRLLAQAGYPNGQDFPEVAYLYVDTPENQRVAEYLQQLWKEALNVTVTLTALGEDECRTALLTGEFTMATFRFDGAYDDAMAFLQRWQSTVSTGAGNLIRYNNRAYDLLIYVVAETASNSAREACLHDAEQLLLDSCGIVPLYYYGRTSQLAEGLTGLYSMADGTYFFQYVAPEQVDQLEE